MDGHETYEAIDFCRDCTPPVPMANETLFENCYAVTPSKLYYIEDYYHVIGAD